MGPFRQRRKSRACRHGATEKSRPYNKSQNRKHSYHPYARLLAQVNSRQVFNHLAHE